MVVSKTRFLSGQACLKRAYLETHSPELAAPVPVGAQERMREGTEVGRLARSLFKGVLVEATFGDIEKAAIETRRLIASGERVLFEATFLTADAVAKVDILERLDEGWHVIEVKSSKSVKDEHIVDVAFQKAVLEECGERVIRASLMHVSDTFVGGGRVDPALYFVTEDVTGLIAEKLAEIRTSLSALSGVLDKKEAPDVAPNVHCKRCECPFIPHCFKGLSEHDVTTLPRVSYETVEHLHAVGARDIRQLPEGTRLTPRQRLIAGVVQHDDPFISPDLRDSLASLRYPLHFLDFEAWNSALPTLPGTKPYQAVPFQWSCHVMDAPAAPTRHHEFLHEEDSDPRPAFVRSLWELIQNAGTVLYYTAYEVSRLRDLAGTGVPCADLALAKVIEGGTDLRRIVESHVYVPGFHGSYSIKGVYPALVPKASYRDLEIQDGDTAAVEYRRMLSPATTPQEGKAIAVRLREYCERDTWAMVEVFRALERLAK